MVKKLEINEIKQKAKDIIDKKEEDRFVGRYVDLLEIKKQTEKQLKAINKSIKKYEDAPEDFCDDTDDIW